MAYVTTHILDTVPLMVVFVLIVESGAYDSIVAADGTGSRVDRVSGTKKDFGGDISALV